jgi:hypothetical protein
MVRTFLKVYMELGSYFLFLQEQIKDIIITGLVVTTKTGDTSGDNNDSVEMCSLRLSETSIVDWQTVIKVTASHGTRRLARGNPHSHVTGKNDENMVQNPNARNL